MTTKQDLLRALPSITELLATEDAAGWLAEQPRGLVTEALRAAVQAVRAQVLADAGGRCGAQHVTSEAVLQLAGAWLAERTRPHIRPAINATGIVLHTELGRAVWPEHVVDAVAAALKGYVTVAYDEETGTRLERDKKIEYLLTELTGAEAATVVNNNAAATLLVLAALAAGREVIVSRGQLIEIGGSFRLPEVMTQSGARLVEVGSTNRTHPRDYAAAITSDTAALLRVHPSNYRVVGFTSEVSLAEMAEIAHGRGVLALDDLGAGALVDLSLFGLPHEPTAAESIAAGADAVLFSGDKLIGSTQAGIIVGRKEIIDRLRKHPLMRALRVDKACLLALEHTLPLFRAPERLAATHPLYRTLAEDPDEIKYRAGLLESLLKDRIPDAQVTLRPGVGYLGSGSLPMEGLPTWTVTLSVPGRKAHDLARRLRLDDACVVTRIEHEQVVFDLRTVREDEVIWIVYAVGRVVG